MLQRHFKSISSQHDGSNLYPFANAVFSSWDFCVFNDRSKRLRQRQIGNQFKYAAVLSALDMSFFFSSQNHPAYPLLKAVLFSSSS